MKNISPQEDFGANVLKSRFLYKQAPTSFMNGMMRPVFFMRRRYDMSSNLPIKPIQYLPYYVEQLTCRPSIDVSLG